MAGRIDPRLLQRSWLHAHEEDTPGKTVFRPSTYALRPSRGRNGYEFLAGGRVIRLGHGPTDRRTSAQGTWSLDTQGRVTIHIPGSPDEVFQIENLEQDRLVVKK